MEPNTKICHHTIEFCAQKQTGVEIIHRIMSDFDQNRAKLDTECGLKLFTRLASKKRPSLLGLLPEIMPNDGPKPGEIVEISGETGTGKTMHTMDLIAQAIIPKEYGGKGATAIIIDTNSNFHVPDQMAKFVEKHIFHYRSLALPAADTETLQNDTEVRNIDSIVFEVLKKIQFFKCYSGKEYELTMLYCTNVLMTNTNVSLLVVDSISTFYWSDLNDRDPPIRMETYLRRKVQELRNLVDEFKLVAIYTRPKEFGNFTTAKDDLIDYKIHLKCTNEQLSEQSVAREAHSYYADNKQLTRKFVINNHGIEWLSSK